MADQIRLFLDSANRGRWAVKCGDLLIRCRTKSEARRLHRIAQGDPLHPYKCVVRRWHRGKSEWSRA